MRKSKLDTTTAILRNLIGLSTSEFAEMAGISVSTIEKIESKRLKLSGSLAVVIAKVTGVHLKWLEDGDTSRPPLTQRLSPYGIEDYRLAQSKLSLLPDKIRLKRELKQAHGSGLLLGEKLGGAFAAAWAKDKEQFLKAKQEAEQFIKKLSKKYGYPPEEFLEMRTRADVTVKHQDGGISEIVTPPPKSLKKDINAQTDRLSNHFKELTGEGDVFVHDDEDTYWARWKLIRPANGIPRGWDQIYEKVQEVIKSKSK